MRRPAVDRPVAVLLAVVALCFPLAAGGFAGPAFGAPGDPGEITTLDHPETVSPDGTFTVTVETTNSAGTVVTVDPEGFEVDLSSEDAVRIDGNRVEFLDADAEGSSYTITAEVTGGSDGDTAAISAWVNDQQQAEADDVATSTVSVSEPDDGHPEITNLQISEASGSDDLQLTADVTAGTAEIETVSLGASADFTSYLTTTAADSVPATGGTVSATVGVETLVGDGSYSGYALVTDTAGQRTVLRADSVTVDTTPPEPRARVSDLGTKPATLTLEADEQFSVTELQVDARTDTGRTGDRTPSTPTGQQSTFAIEFDSREIYSENTTFTINYTVEDTAGNQRSDTLNASVTGYTVGDNETVTVDPSSVDGEFVLRTRNTTGSKQSTVSQSATPPANTNVAASHVTGQFIDVTDIGLGDENLTSATVRIPVDQLDLPTDEIDESDLTLLRSADGESAFSSDSVSNVRVEGGILMADVPGFSTVVPSVTDDTPPEITDSTVDPTANPDPDGSVTATFEYADSLSAINVSATTVTVADVDSDRVETQITPTSAETTVSGLSTAETFAIELTVVDTAGNERTVTESISVEGGGGSGTSGGSPAVGGQSPTSSAPTGSNSSQPANATEASEPVPNVSGGVANPTVPFPSNPADVSMTAYVTARLSPGADGTRSVDFTGGSRMPTVRSISFAADSAETDVRTADYSRLPSALDEPGAEVVSTVEILVPPSLEATDATITAGVDRAAIPDGQESGDLVVLRRADGDWQPLATTVVESTGDEVVIEAETPGFSYFTVVAADGRVDPSTIQQVVGPEDGQSTPGDQSTTADQPETADETPTLGLGGVVGSLVLTSLLLARRARRTPPK